MKIGKQIQVLINYEELFDWIAREMPQYDIDEILTSDSAGFDKDGNLSVELKLK